MTSAEALQFFSVTVARVAWRGCPVNDERWSAPDRTGRDSGDQQQPSKGLDTNRMSSPYVHSSLGGAARL